MKTIRFILVALLLLTPGFIFSCGWDWDTIKMEKQAFPSIHELITGKFIRHSPEFYIWRTENRIALLKQYPDSLSLYDDLGWAYDKLGEHQKAISIFLKKDALKPSMYETYANLGTAYIHDQQFTKGVSFIKKAIEINPEAHFGREIYQQHLVEYILSKSDSTGHFDLPLASGNSNFYHYLSKHQFNKPEMRHISNEARVAVAIKGVAGMMQFGNFNSPILLEALADLLAHSKNGQYKGAGHLASRAYMKASLLVKAKDAKKAYRKKANAIQEIQFSHRSFRRHIAYDSVSEKYNHSATPTGDPLIGIKGIESILKLEIQSANKWYEQLRADELNWIATSHNPDSSFAVKYYDVPVQKPVNRYNYSQRENEIDEAYWLRVQLENPNNLANIHNGIEVSDSVREMLEDAYKREFMPKAKNDEIEQTIKSKPIPYLKIGVAILVLVLLLRTGYQFFYKKDS